MKQDKAEPRSENTAMNHARVATEANQQPHNEIVAK